METARNAWHLFYSLEMGLALGQGDGFNVFAHEESRDAELKLSNIPEREMLDTAAHCHSTVSFQRMKPCLPASENSEIGKEKEN